ncbi:hypothetical protein AO375_0836 [Moraxella catarrhalis]|nr:hypothetical protein AO375_0836 [Moraxella catarrhalis]
MLSKLPEITKVSLSLPKVILDWAIAPLLTKSLPIFRVLLPLPKSTFSLRPLKVPPINIESLPLPNSKVLLMVEPTPFFRASRSSPSPISSLNLGLAIVPSTASLIWTLSLPAPILMVESRSNACKLPRISRKSSPAPKLIFWVRGFATPPSSATEPFNSPKRPNCSKPTTRVSLPFVALMALLPVVVA